MITEAPRTERRTRTVTASAPARIDLAGGWSDCPPLCCDLGGAVVNLAVRIGGRDPIGATVERCEGDGSGADWIARMTNRLQLAALDVSGVDRHCLSVRTRSDIPVGSGLGTSSILAGALLATLWRLDGRMYTNDDLIAGVLDIERGMGSNGGWQDQVGGIEPGVKYSTTAPGEEQRPSVRPIKLSPAVRAALEERSIVWYTGRSREARGILESVVGKYRSEPRRTGDKVRTLKILAYDVYEELRGGSIHNLGLLLDMGREIVSTIAPEHWPGWIEERIAPVREHLAGYKPCGAGGGGFAYLLAKSAGDAERVRSILAATCPEGRCYPLEIADGGLRVEAE